MQDGKFIHVYLNIKCVFNKYYLYMIQKLLYNSLCIGINVFNLLYVKLFLSIMYFLHPHHYFKRKCGLDVINRERLQKE